MRQTCSMADVRLPCPVCLGAKMVKERAARRRDVVVDRCSRCGGIWFEAGEVQLLRAGSRFDLPPEAEQHRAKCHACFAVVERDAESCPACGYVNRLECPSCCTPMQRVEHEGVTLDLCRSCTGVWFDRHEISAVWTLALTTAVAKRPGSHGGVDGAGGALDASGALVDALLYAPDVGVMVVHGSARAIGASLEALPELLGAGMDAAGAVFDVLVSIVAAVLEGL